MSLKKRSKSISVQDKI